MAKYHKVQHWFCTYKVKTQCLLLFCLYRMSHILWKGIPSESLLTTKSVDGDWPLMLCQKAWVNGYQYPSISFRNHFILMFISSFFLFFLIIMIIAICMDAKCKIYFLHFNFFLKEENNYKAADRQQINCPNHMANRSSPTWVPLAVVTWPVSCLR